MSDVIPRLYDRMQRAKYDRAEYMEITREEYDYCLAQTTHRDDPPPSDWPEWAKRWRLELPHDRVGLIFGFPVKVVPALSPDSRPEET